MMSKVFLGRVKDNLEELILESLQWIEWENIIRPDSRVFIKPNFTFPTYKPGVTTSPFFLEALIKILRTRCGNITLGETDGGYYAWKAEEAFLNHNLYGLKKKYNINVLNLYDSEVEYIEFRIGPKLYKIPLPKFLLHDIDVFISAPVLKVHSMTGFTFGLKNQWGCILDPFRMRYHHIFKEAILKINEILNPKILISDPFYLLTDKGPMDGRVVPFDTLIVSDNLYAFEEIGSKILGVKLEEVDYLSFIRGVGKFPSADSLKINAHIEEFVTQQYNLKLSLKDRFTHKVFSNEFLTYFLYYSKLGILLHKVYYCLTGKKNKIKLNF